MCGCVYDRHLGCTCWRGAGSIFFFFCFVLLFVKVEGEEVKRGLVVGCKLLFIFFFACIAV